jgi:group II intron reverse transcriptase/maturase
MINYEETKSQPITRWMVWQAYKEVRANKGSGGVDGKDWDYMDKHVKTELYKLWNRLTSGSYYPQVVRQVGIPKKDGGVRKLGIPTILDRVAQQVVKTYLERVLEPIFHEDSYGYRPKRNCHDAISQAHKRSMTNDFVIDIDIKGFFDTINHEKMMKGLRHYCKAKWVLLYVSRWLKGGVLEIDGTLSPTLIGTPQGGVISPLLANLYLHITFDEWMKRNHPEKPFERYADDIVVHCKTEKQSRFMLKEISRRMSECDLSLHPEKTKIVNLRGESENKYPKSYDFLGFSIQPVGLQCKTGVKAMPSISVSKKSKKSILEKFRSMEIHKRRKPIEEIAKDLNKVIRGLINYYHKFENYSMRRIWFQLNARLLKWVKWQKGLYKYAAIAYLKAKHKEKPDLFAHWLLVYP